MRVYQARPLVAAVVLALMPLAVLADGVSVRYDLTDPSGSPFPSDRFSVRDWSNLSFRRVNLPKPDCTVRPSDCADVDVINTLDGFSTQPRITVPFSGAIDLSTVSSQTIYLVNLGDTHTSQGLGQRVGINQIVWDPDKNTLAFESDELLAQHSRYLLVVTDGVRDSNGKKIKMAKEGEYQGADDYLRELRDSMQGQRHALHKIVAASLFTTQSITADLEKIGYTIRNSSPAPVDFMIGSGGAVRAVFPVSSVAGIQFNRQTGTAPVFTRSFLPTPALGVVPGSVGQIAYGRFQSPSYLTADKYLPATATGSSGRAPRCKAAMNLFSSCMCRPVPSPRADGRSRFSATASRTACTARHGRLPRCLRHRVSQTLAINVPGHGGGALGSLTVLRTGGATPVGLPAGGRGIDQDGNGVIDSTEGVNATAPRTIISSRDGLRQTVIDLMQLVRQVRVGVDMDGDGTVDLNAQRIYYAGQSFGGIYGTIFLGVEPAIKAGVPNVPGGSISEVARLGGFRFLTALALAQRVPQLLNLPPTSGVPVPFNLNFNENIPLRNQPTVVNTVPGAMEITELLERNEWVQQSGNPVSYAPHIRKQPLPGNTAKPVIIQFAKGDMTVPNPTNSAILRAGDLADRATFFRNDLAFAVNPVVGKNPHTFVTNIGNTVAAPYAVGGQQQIAIFFASHGATVIDPDGAGPFFEVPVSLPLPETLNFIP